MIGCFIVIVIYVVMLGICRAEPRSLREPLPSISRQLALVSGSLYTGIFIVLCFLFTSGLSFNQSTEKMILVFGLSNSEYMNQTLIPYQYLTNNLMHLDINHMITNLIGLGVASVYERRVGSRRFMAVLIVGSLTSSFAIFCYDTYMVKMGISGGVMALGAAYLTDYRRMSWKESTKAFLFMLLVLAIYTGWIEMQAPKDPEGNVVIDHAGHILGALAGATYCIIHKRKADVIQVTPA